MRSYISSYKSILYRKTGKFFVYLTLVVSPFIGLLLSSEFLVGKILYLLNPDNIFIDWMKENLGITSFYIWMVEIIVVSLASMILGFWVISKLVNKYYLETRPSLVFLVKVVPSLIFGGFVAYSGFFAVLTFSFFLVVRLFLAVLLQK